MDLSEMHELKIIAWNTFSFKKKEREMILHVHLSGIENLLKFKINYTSVYLSCISEHVWFSAVCSWYLLFQ